MRTTTRIAVLATSVLAFAAGIGGAAQADISFEPGALAGQTNSNVAGAATDFETAFTVTKTIPGGSKPDGTLKEVDVALPKGFVGNPQATPTCSMAQVIGDLTGDPCPIEAAIGVVDVQIFSNSDNPTDPPQTYRSFVFNVNPDKGEPAAFGFAALFLPVRMTAKVGPSGDYQIHANLRNLTEMQSLTSIKMTLWGVPADHQGPGGEYTLLGREYGAPRLPAGDPGRKRFFNNASTCDGAPQVATLTPTSWQVQQPLAPLVTNNAPLTGCDQLEFDPTIEVAPDSKAAGKPSGYQVELTVPQNDDADQPAVPALKDAVVALPKGVALSAPVADGLNSCTDEQLDLHGDDKETCPAASKIGTMRLDTPLLADPMVGSIYVGSQQSSDPESGKMYRLFLTAAGSGVRIKLRGSVKADASTGQLTATFLDNPRLPFSKLKLDFKDGDRAPLVNPPTCGSYTTNGTIDSWGGQSRPVSSSFDIDQGCPTDSFTPSLTAGTLSPLAGSFSPFSTTITRTDGDQELSRISVALPSGLLGALGSVPLCSEAQAAAGSCDPSTRVGVTTVGVGTGGSPYFLGGKVFLAGPYKGAPFSLSIVVDAKAGPFDLGLVVVRAPLFVDANKASAVVVSDPLPQIVGGVPMHYRTVNVTLDRPGFTFNATSCQPMQVAGRLESAKGAIATPAVPYQAQGCDKVKLNPQLSLQFTGKTSELAAPEGKRGHPGVKAAMSWPFGDSGLKQVKVELPLAVALDADNAQGLCKPAEAAARACPASSIVGQATARTQALHEPLTGPIYFVEGTRVTESGKVVPALPKLWLKLAGEGVPLDLWANSDVNPKTQQLTTTFVDIPDAPISGFEMEIKSGAGGILAATQNVCAAKKTSVVRYSGQNGGSLTKNVAFTTPTCGLQIASAKVSGTKLAVRVGGIGAGRLSVSGKGIGKTTRTIKASAAATVKAPLTKATRSAVSKGRSVKVKVAVRFTPKTGKAVTVKKTVTIKGKKQAAKKK